MNQEREKNYNTIERKQGRKEWIKAKLIKKIKQENKDNKME